MLARQPTLTRLYCGMNVFDDSLDILRTPNGDVDGCFHVDSEYSDPERKHATAKTRIAKLGMPNVPRKLQLRKMTDSRQVS